jgi:hypothetical protein
VLLFFKVLEKCPVSVYAFAGSAYGSVLVEKCLLMDDLYTQVGDDIAFVVSSVEVSSNGSNRV